MRRYNQRVYRIGRAVLRNDAEAEELTQETWVRAFTHLSAFETRCRFSTWLTRIALHEAWARGRRARRFRSVSADAESEGLPIGASECPDPEQEAGRREISMALESAIEALPAVYRTVFLLREVEGMSTEQTADSLELTPGAVKVRLHRARARLRRELGACAGIDRGRAFPFLGDQCDRTVRSVFSVILSAESVPS